MCGGVGGVKVSTHTCVSSWMDGRERGETLFTHSVILRFFISQMTVVHSIRVDQLRVQKLVAGHRIHIIVKPVHWMKKTEEVVDITTASTELYKLFMSVCLEEFYIVRICSSLKEKQFLSAYKSFCKGMHEQCIKKEQTALWYQPVNNHRHWICIVCVFVKLNINCHKET